MEDDHVDRPGVDVQQCMKLTGTNRPIGLIVLIVCAHQALLDDAKDLCPDADATQWVATLRTARAKRRDGRGPVWVPKALVRSGKVQRRVQKTKKEVERPHQLLTMLRFADLVVIAGRPHPFPFRTRP